MGMMIHTAVSCQFFNAIHFSHADLSSLIFSWQKGPASNNFFENILQIVWNFVLVVDIVFPYFTRENNTFWFEIFWNWVHDGIFCGLSLNTVCKYEWHFIFIFVLWNISLGILFRWKLCLCMCVRRKIFSPSCALNALTAFRIMLKWFLALDGANHCHDLPWIRSGENSKE